jgi:hypothetical protein
LKQDTAIVYLDRQMRKVKMKKKKRLKCRHTWPMNPVERVVPNKKKDKDRDFLLGKLLQGQKISEMDLDEFDDIYGGT